MSALTVAAKLQQASIAFKGDLWCPFPLKVDTYQGCGHLCVYCSARLQRRTAYQRTFHVPRGLDTLKRQIAGKTATTAWRMVLEGLSFQWGTVADPFPPIERDHRRSLDALRLFAHLGLSFTVCTKSTILGEPEYLQEFKTLGNRFLLRMSFSTLDDRLASILEPFAPPPSERLALLRRFTDLGFNTLARLSPVIPAVTFERVTPEEIGKTLRRLWDSCRYVNFHPIVVDFRSENVAWKPMFESLGMRYENWKHLYLEHSKGMGNILMKPTNRWLVAFIRAAREAADSLGVKIGFDSGPGTLGAFNSDGPTCCGEWEGIRHNPDAVIPMVKDGRVNTLEYKREFSLPPKHLGRLRTEIVKLVGKARKAKATA